MNYFDHEQALIQPVLSSISEQRLYSQSLECQEPGQIYTSYSESDQTLTFGFSRTKFIMHQLKTKPGYKILAYREGSQREVRLIKATLDELGFSPNSNGSDYKCTRELIRYLKFCPDGPLTIANPFLLKDCSIKNDKLIGIATGVPFARHVKNIVTVIDGNLILAPSLISHEGLNMAGEVRDNIFWKEAEVIVGPKVSQETVMEKGALMRSAQICGALQHALDKSTNYATERKQFGRSLSKFQTIQNYLAKMASLTAMAEAALSNAIHLESTKTIATAKSCASEAGGEVASLAHRIHGAIGFTHEYSLHHLTRRLLSWREEFGAESWWHDRLGRIAIKAGSDNLWAMITSKH